jgi:hypothetical protein
LLIEPDEFELAIGVLVEGRWRSHRIVCEKALLAEHAVSGMV